MATIVNKAGKYQATIRHKLLKKPFYATFYDKGECESKVAAIEASLDRGVIPTFMYEQQGITVTVSKLINDYIGSRGDKLPSKDKSQLNKIADQNHTFKANLLNINWLEDFVSDMARRGLSAGTISKYMGALRRCIKWAEGRKSYGVTLKSVGFPYMDRNYIQQSGAKPNVERNVRPIAEMDDNIKAYLYSEKTVNRHGERKVDQYWLLYRLAIESAMRLSEIFSLQAHNIHVDEGYIFLENTKNGNDREVPLNSIILKELKAFMTRYRYSKKAWIFDTLNAEIQQYPQVVKKGHADFIAWRKARQAVTSRISGFWDDMFVRCGQPELCFHDLRHEATCRIYQNTQLSDIQIQKITGHVSLQSLSRYASLRAEDLRPKLW